MIKQAGVEFVLGCDENGEILYVQHKGEMPVPWEDLEDSDPPWDEKLATCEEICILRFPHSASGCRRYKSGTRWKWRRY